MVQLQTAAQRAISVRAASFYYPTGLQVIGDLSLDVARGQILGIVGPSGCGKSTLLSLLAGILEPSMGEVIVADDGTSRHLLTMVFQQDTLLPWLTVEENVKIYYRFHRSDDVAVRQHVAELIHFAGLDGFEKSFPYQLSGGMRRRVAFLAAVMASPQILLLDEPFSSLDEPTRIAIHQDASRILRQLETTVVLVTHDLAEAITLCDEVVILTGAPARVFSRHRIPFEGERDMLKLRQTHEFLEGYRTLWNDLSLQLGRTESTYGDATDLDRPKSVGDRRVDGGSM